MARQHRMTPARRAALRKAQLTSARKRRKGGVGAAAKRSASQRVAYTRVNVRLNKKRTIRRVAGTVAVGVVLGSAIAGSRRPSATNHARPATKVHSQRVFGQPTRALTTGPRGKSTVRSRNYRARQRAA